MTLTESMKLLLGNLEWQNRDCTTGAKPPCQQNLLGEEKYISSKEIWFTEKSKKELEKPCYSMRNRDIFHSQLLKAQL